MAMSKKEIVELAETPSINIKLHSSNIQVAISHNFHAMEPNVLVIPGIMLFLYEV